LLAEEFVNGEPFAVLFGDDVMYSEKPVLAQLIEVFERENKTVIGVQSVGYENLAKYAACDFNLHEGNIYNVTALVEKPDPSIAKSDIAPLGRYVLRADFFENLHNLKPGIHGEYQLTDALAMEIDREGLLAYEFEGRRFDTGDVFGFLQANIEFSLQNPEYKDKMQEYLKNLVKKF
jgi:UTP--glucose-1-phosphate uridylyltransferase